MLYNSTILIFNHSSNLKSSLSHLWPLSEESLAAKHSTLLTSSNKYATTSNTAILTDLQTHSFKQTALAVHTRHMKVLHYTHQELCQQAHVLLFWSLWFLPSRVNLSRSFEDSLLFIILLFCKIWKKKKKKYSQNEPPFLYSRSTSFFSWQSSNILRDHNVYKNGTAFILRWKDGRHLFSSQLGSASLNH
jgi:hypothetical protein